MGSGEGGRGLCPWPPSPDIMDQGFGFKLKKSAGPAGPRLGQVITARGVIDTPVFMPVGTYATVKTLTPFRRQPRCCEP